MADPVIPPEQVAEIRARVDAAPHFGRLHFMRNGRGGYEMFYDPQGDPCPCFGCMGTIDATRLLAHAPTDLRALLDDRAALVAENERLREALVSTWDHRALRDRIDDLVNRNPEHGFRPDAAGHNCERCDPDSIWKCDAKAHELDPDRLEAATIFMAEVLVGQPQPNTDDGDGEESHQWFTNLAQAAITAYREHFTPPAALAVDP